jgi:hypothetical protein
MKQPNVPMEESEMESELLQWFGTRAYEAAWQYAQKRKELVGDALFGIDPFKNPSGISQSQGIKMGLFDLFDYVRMLVKREQDRQKADEKASE